MFSAVAGIKLFSIAALVIGLTATQTYAKDSGPFYTCIGEESLCSTFANEFHSLPKCTQLVISKDFKRVIFDKDSARKLAASSHMTTEGIEALSDPDGSIYIDSTGYRIKTDIFHELGHFYAWNSQILDYSKFVKAVAIDFDNMSEEDYDWNYYLISPQEAYAEIFAEYYQGQDYYKTLNYKPRLLTESKKIFLKSLCEDE